MRWMNVPRWAMFGAAAVILLVTARLTGLIGDQTAWSHAKLHGHFVSRMRGVQRTVPTSTSDERE